MMNFPQDVEMQLGYGDARIFCVYDVSVAHWNSNYFASRAERLCGTTLRVGSAGRLLGPCTRPGRRATASNHQIYHTIETLLWTTEN